MSSIEDDVRKRLEAMVGKEGFDYEELDALTRLVGDRRAEALLQQRSPDAVERLRMACAAFNTPVAFKVGDILQWKEDLKNKRNPAPGQPTIVFAVVDPPERDEANDAGSAYFHERLDIIIGYIDPDDPSRVKTFHVDSHRFEHHPEFRS